MNILLLGSGGREHAFAWKISQSKKCNKLYIAPGNPGTAQCGENVSIAVNDFEKIARFSLEKNIKILIVGPEDPLVNGIYDYFQNNKELKNIAVIGPSKNGAMLEGSKNFAKEFMQKYKIPTAKYQTFTKDTLQNGIEFLKNLQPPFVLKADGLAAGKGVVICSGLEEAEKELTEMLEDEKFGNASAKVVIEEFLKGIEFSVFVLTDGKNYKILPTAKDYKRIGEKDMGLNTGGMGAVSPVPFVHDELLKKVEEQIIQPTISGLQKEKIIYKGFIYFGLIASPPSPLSKGRGWEENSSNPFVIEYNCRMGDPETEVVIPRIKSDLVELFEAVADGNLGEKKIEVDERFATTVVLVSGGYPGNYEKAKTVSGIREVKDSIIFHAGTKLNKKNELITSGGRVFAVTSYGKDIASALVISKVNAEKIGFDKKYFRRDIGLDLINE